MPKSTELTTARTKTDEVYHFTSSDLVNLENLNLEPNPERGWGEWRKLEELLENQRPEHIIQMGISRLEAVFANPTIAQINSPYSWGAEPEEQDAYRIAIAVEVDPSKVVVCDASLLDHTLVLEDLVAKMANAYWGSAISLMDFRKIYEPENYSSTGLHRIRPEGKEPSSGYRDEYFRPEVLIPGPINSDYLCVAACGIRNQMQILHSYDSRESVIAVQ